MANRIIRKTETGYVEQRTLSRSFDTLDAAQKFAEGKDVRDIYKSCGRFKVEWVKTTQYSDTKRVLFDGEEITPETAMKWFCWHEIVAAMEKQADTLHEVAELMHSGQLQNVHDWEYRFLCMFLDFAKEDLVIERKV